MVCRQGKIQKNLELVICNSKKTKSSFAFSWFHIYICRIKAVNFWCESFHIAVACTSSSATLIEVQVFDALQCVQCNFKSPQHISWSSFITQSAKWRKLFNYKVFQSASGLEIPRLRRICKTEASYPKRFRFRLNYDCS